MSKKLILGKTPKKYYLFGFLLVFIFFISFVILKQVEAKNINLGTATDDILILGNANISKSLTAGNMGGANLLTDSTNMAAYGGASVTSLPFVDGKTVQVLDSPQTGTNNCYMWGGTEKFKINPNNDYEYSIWLRANGIQNAYVGFYVYDSSGSIIGTNDLSNPYFHTSAEQTNNGWMKVTAFLRSSATPRNVNSYVATTNSDKTSQNTSDWVMPSNAVYAMMRFGSCYGGTGTTGRVYMYNPVVREVSTKYDDNYGAIWSRFNGTNYNVGVGVTNPSLAKLQVAGAMRGDLGTTGASLTLTGTGSNLQIKHNGAGTPVEFYNSSGTGYSFNGNVAASSFSGPMSGTLNAANVSGGVFGDNIGGGNYYFPYNTFFNYNYDYNENPYYNSFFLGSNQNYSTNEYGFYGAESGYSFLVFNNDDNVLHLSDFMSANYGTGFIGIGVDAPSSKLEIQGGPLRLTGTYLDINRIASNNSGIVWYSQGNNAWANYMSPTGAGMGPKGNLTAPSGNLVSSWALRSFIENVANYGWTFESGGLNATTPAVKFEIRSSDGSFHSYGNGLVDGNVGIGTTNPGAKLEITNQSAFNTVTPGLGTSYGVHFNGQLTADYANGITWNGGTSGAQAGLYVQGSGGYGTKMYFATTDSYATGAKTRMMINHSGKVGIGTTAPGYQLDVQGGQINASGGLCMNGTCQTAWNQIGTANLLNNSGRFTNVSGWTSTSGATISVDSSVKYGNYNTMKIVGANGAYNNTVMRLKANTTYTVSALVKGSSSLAGGTDTHLHIQSWRDEDTVNVHQETSVKYDQDITTGWKVIYQTFTTPASANATYSRLYFYPLAAAYTLNVAYVKVEQGNMYSDWTIPTDEISTASNIPSVSGTTNYIAKFTGSSSVGNSVIFDDGTNIGIGLANPVAKLDVSNSIQQSGDNSYGVKGYVALDNNSNYSDNEYGGYFLADGVGLNNSYGIYAKSASQDFSNESIGVYGEGSSMGVYGYGYYGIYGSGSAYGVYGYGATVGVYANSSAGYGLYSSAPKNYFSGKVGIGTSTPVANLEVNGSAFVSGALSAKRVQASGGVDFYNNGYSFSSGDTDGGMFSPADGTLVFATDNSEKVRITPAGNFGIGKTPGYKLDVNGNVLFSRNTTLTDEQGNLRLATASDGNKALILGYSYASDVAYIQPVHSSATWAKNLAISPNGGNVGIGTTNPGARLEVTDSSFVSSGTQDQYVPVVFSTRSDKSTFYIRRQNIHEGRQWLAHGNVTITAMPYGWGSGGHGLLVNTTAFGVMNADNTGGTVSYLGKVKVDWAGNENVIVWLRGGTTYYTDGIIIPNGNTGSYTDGASNSSVTVTVASLAYGSPTAGYGVAKGTYRADMEVNNNSKNYEGDYSVSGAVIANAFQYNSDRSLKKNITTIESPLTKILKLRGVTFNWKKDNSPSVGLIAQEVETVFPELVTENQGIKSVQYGNLVAPLIEAVKDQQKQIEKLNTRIKTLELKK